MRPRYRRTIQEEELARLYHISIPKLTDLPISYNIAPSQKVFTIRFNPETRQRRRRSLDALQWGLIPYWAKDSKIAYRTINARAEAVDKAPSFRHAFIKRRCLIPADSFYKWRKTAKPKLPFAIATKRVLADPCNIPLTEHYTNLPSTLNRRVSLLTTMPLSTPAWPRPGEGTRPPNRTSSRVRAGG